MKTYSLKIIASDKVFFEGRVKYLVLPNTEGDCAVMAHHENMVMAVTIGELWFRNNDNSVTHVVVSDGVAQIVNNRVLVIVDSAERPEDIDVVRARQALERANERLRQKQSIQEYYRSKASLARAMERLKASSHDRPIGY